MGSIVRDLRGIVSSPARKRSPVASSALHEGYTFFGSDARARWLRGVPVCSSHDACHATTRDTLVASTSRGTLPRALMRTASSLLPLTAGPGHEAQSSDRVEQTDRQQAREVATIRCVCS